jgi:hypothetical protein
MGFATAPTEREIRNEAKAKEATQASTEAKEAFQKSTLDNLSEMFPEEKKEKVAEKEDEVGDSAQIPIVTSTNTRSPLRLRSVEEIEPTGYILSQEEMGCPGPYGLASMEFF